MPGSILQLVTFKTLGHTWEQHILDPKRKLQVLEIESQDLGDKIFICILKSAHLESNGFLTLIFIAFSQSCIFKFSPQDL